MEKSNTESEAIADANFIGWSRWAAEELIHALAPKAGMSVRKSPPAIDLEPADTQASDLPA